VAGVAGAAGATAAGNGASGAAGGTSIPNPASSRLPIPWLLRLRSPPSPVLDYPAGVAKNCDAGQTSR